MIEINFYYQIETQEATILILLLLFFFLSFYFFSLPLEWARNYFRRLSLETDERFQSFNIEISKITHQLIAESGADVMSEYGFGG